MSMLGKISKLKKKSGKAALNILKSFQKTKKTARRQIGRPASSGMKHNINIFGKKKRHRKKKRNADFGLNFSKNSKKGKTDAGFDPDFSRNKKKSEDFDFGLDI